LAGTRAIRRVKASGEASLGEYQWAMVIDQTKCIGCGYCTLACQAHNDINPTIQWNAVTHIGELDEKHVFLPRPCMHCEKAPCVEVCPVGATYYRPDGIVMMNYDRCIGCRYCEVACPYRRAPSIGKHLRKQIQWSRNGASRRLTGVHEA